jgi:hypothetical protein
MTTASVDYRVSQELVHDIKGLRTKAGAVGIIFLALTILGAFLDAGQFFRSYLYAFVFWVGLSVGCMVWLMIQYLTGGAWGVMIRRVCESAIKTLPMWLVLFVPLIFGIPYLYGGLTPAGPDGGSWANPVLVAHDAVLRHKTAYLNTPFWIVRGFIYLGVWAFCGWFFNSQSDREDREGGLGPNRAMAKLAAPGIIFWAFAVTFMSTDWVMSVNAHWFSTMFGLLFIAGQGLSSLSFIICVMVLLSHRKPMSELLTPRHMHDLGKFLLANTMLFAYFSFSQFLITWAGNLPDEIPWYKHRLAGGWESLGLFLVIGHFALPFALLLSSDLKRNFKRLRAVALLIIVMRLIGVFWETVPEFFPNHIHVSWMDFTAPIGIGGVWLAFFLSNLLKRPLIPANDPNLERALAHGRE